jgi:hypothetical protein
MAREGLPGSFLVVRGWLTGPPGLLSRKGRDERHGALVLSLGVGRFIACHGGSCGSASDGCTAHTARLPGIEDPSSASGRRGAGLGRPGWSLWKIETMALRVRATAHASLSYRAQPYGLSCNETWTAGSTRSKSTAPMEPLPCDEARYGASTSGPLRADKTGLHLWTIALPRRGSRPGRQRRTGFCA